MKKKLRVAVIGAGWVSTHRHIPILKSHKEVTVVGIVDRTNGRAKEAAQKMGIPKWADTYQLKDIEWLSEIDAVTIGTSPFTHYPLAMEAMELKKDFLTEKPFCMTLSEGSEMIAKANQERRIFAIVHNFQFCRSVKKLIRDIQNGKLGTITSLDAVQLSNPHRRLPTWYEKLPGGLFYDESPHLLYLIRLLGGGKPKLAETYAKVEKNKTPSLLNANYESPLGFPIRLSMNFVAPISEWHILVFGEKALGAVDLFRDIYIRLPNDGLHVTGTVFRTSFLATLKHWAVHVMPGVRHLFGRAYYGNPEVTQRFVKACQTRELPKDIGPQEALEILQMQHEILNAAKLK